MSKEMNTEFELFYKEHGEKIENLGLYELHIELCEMRNKKPKTFIGFCEVMFRLSRKDSINLTDAPCEASKTN